MAPHSSTLAWKIPWKEEPGRLQSMGSLGVGHDWATSLSLCTFMHWRRKWQPTPVFLPGESQGWGNLLGCCLWGRRVRHDRSDLAAAAAWRMGEEDSSEFMKSWLGWPQNSAYMGSPFMFLIHSIVWSPVVLTTAEEQRAKWLFWILNDYHHSLA